MELSGTINATTPLDYNQLFAQALHELGQGVQREQHGWYAKQIQSQ